MSVSHAELQRMCQKTFAALGITGGVERDAALAVLWLETRDLAGLDRLCAELPVLEGTGQGMDQGMDQGMNQGAPALLGRSAAETRLDTRGQSALLVGSAMVELAVVGAGGNGARIHRVIAEPCDAPMFTVALAAGSAAPGRIFHLRWQEDGAELRVLVDEDGRVAIYRRMGRIGPMDPMGHGGRAGGDLGVEPRALEVECRPGPGAALARELARQCGAPTVPADTLEDRYRTSLARGIRVDPDRWALLGALAARALVPDSASSHRQGAGGGRYDD